MKIVGLMLERNDAVSETGDPMDKEIAVLITDDHRSVQ